MMMSRRIPAVAVAMADFFISCIVNVKDLDIKGCGDTSPGLVSIDINIEFVTLTIKTSLCPSNVLTFTAIPGR